MPDLEMLNRDNLDDFLAAPLAVVILAKSDCNACKEWSGELTEHFQSELSPVWDGVRVGKLELDQPGLGSFKKANPWLANVDSLPYNLIYSHGEQKKAYLGSGIERLENRLQRIREEA